MTHLRCVVYLFRYSFKENLIRKNTKNLIENSGNSEVTSNGDFLTLLCAES